MNINFKNKKHAERFFTACAENCVRMDDLPFLAALYLLTVRRKLWEQFKNKVEPEDGIPDHAFRSFKANNQTEEALVAAAYDLLNFTDWISLSDLTSKEEIPDEALLAIVNVIGYMRYGFFDESNEPAITEYA